MPHQINPSPNQMTYPKLLMACVTCFFILGGFHLILNFFYDHITFPSSYTVARNPYFLRGWQHYTAPESTPQHDDTYRVIVITNSQGFMQEHWEDNLSYMSTLEIMLQNQMDQTVEVLNWAAPASNAAEQIILAARAIDHHPDLILWVVHNTNLVREPFQTLDFYSTDISRLVYDPSVRQYLSDRFLRIHNGYDPLAWLNVHTGYGKMSHILDQERYFRWWWTPQELKDTIFTGDWTDQSIFYANEFYETINRSPVPISTRVVSMPLNALPYPPQAWAEMNLLDDRLKDIYDGLPHIQVYDAIDSIPQPMFYTHTHMRPDGHNLFAKWLYQHVFEPQLAS